MSYLGTKPAPLENVETNRKPGTLRGWACNGNGPIQPQRVGGRLAWPVAEIRKQLGVAA